MNERWKDWLKEKVKEEKPIDCTELFLQTLDSSRRDTLPSPYQEAQSLLTSWGWNYWIGSDCWAKSNPSRREKRNE